MQELEQLIRKLKILEFKFIFFKLPKKEQLLYLKEYCRKKYDLEEPLSERFYELLLTKVKKDIEFLIKNNDIYQVIASIKEREDSICKLFLGMWQVFVHV